jgi:hypothetical protein
MIAPCDRCNEMGFFRYEATEFTRSAASAKFGDVEH